MTPKQMYSELSKIAGFRCASGETFINSSVVTEAELHRVQRGMLALLDKLNYARAGRDFRGSQLSEVRMRRMTEEQIRLERIREEGVQLRRVVAETSGVLDVPSFRLGAQRLSIPNPGGIWTDPPDTQYAIPESFTYRTAMDPAVPYPVPPGFPSPTGEESDDA